MKIDTVIPAYNEEGNVANLFRRLVYTFRRLGIEGRFLFVIQGNHKAVEEIDEISKSENVESVDVFYFKQPQGVGRAFKIGFEKISSDCDYVLTMDADLNHQPEELDKFISAIKDADIIVGSRYIKGGLIKGLPLWKLILSRLVNEFLTFLLGIKVKDKTSGYRLIKKEVVLKITPKLEALNFDFYVEFMLRAISLGAKIKEVPITFAQRRFGHSKMKTMNTLLSYLSLFIRTRRICTDSDT